ncbi:MFS transporter [Spirosoma rhododendri]|uniref:MFS transporter n=1 Tax=Spirosoma rhododendri TaxID=2728024 RepID=A0A7L5DL85_9BACT|nr:MFS transporter [Spirosoma rhododendri]QJD78292.1 MFS transporter [Spirosoma rhododendri]
MLKNRQLLLIYALVLIDVVVGAAISPVMPKFVAHQSHPELWLSGATALFLGLQLFSGPLLGKLADYIGRRPILILSSIGTALANLLLLPVKASLLLLNRVSDGLTNGMFATVRSAITDVSPEENLVKNLGIQGTIVSLGNVLGPMVAGGLLTLFTIPEKEQTSYIVYIALGLSVLNIGISLLISETSEKKEKLDQSKLKQTIIESINPVVLWRQLVDKEAERPGLQTLVLIRTVLALTQGYYTYFVTYLALGPLKFGTQSISYFFIYYGGFSVITSFIFYRFLADRLNQTRAMFWFAILGVPVLIGYGLVGKSTPILYGLVAVDCLSIGLISGIVEGLIAKRTNDDDRGTLFGLVQGLQGFASLITTLLFGALSALDLRLPFIWFGITMAVVIWLAYRTYRDKPALFTNGVE